MKKELLDILCCPVCKGELEWREKEEILYCPSCGRKYEVKNGIPNLLPEEGEKER